MSPYRIDFVLTCTLITGVCASGCSGIPSQPLRLFPPRELASAAKVVPKSVDSGTAQTVSRPAPATSNEPVFGPPGAPATHDQAMATVLEDLEEIRAIDPQAQQLLLEDLKTSKPSLWPLMVQQFRAALSYRQQLAEKEGSLRPAGGELARVSHDHTLRSNGRKYARASSEDTIVAAVSELVDGQDRATATAADDLTQPVGSRFGRATEGDENDSFETNRRNIASASRRTRETVERLPSPTRHGVSLAAFETQPDAGRDSSQTGRVADKFGLQAASIDRANGDDPLSWREHVEQAVQLLSATAARHPRTAEEVGEHARQRLLHLAIGRASEGVEPIDGIPPLERDYWSHQLFALATFSDVNTQPDGKRRASAAAVHLEDALWQLRKLGVLTVRNLAFCQEVFDYGAYEVYPSNRFSPGRQVALYAEVENYQSELTEKGYYTSLASSYEVLSDEGQRVASGEFPDVEDYCRNRRRDFHIQYGLALPDRVPPGHYRLQLTIQDNQSHKIGQNVIEFDIVGGGAGQ